MGKAANQAVRRSRVATPRTLPPEVRREALMEAAAALLIAKGIDATTIDDIVSRAGVAKGTFYHYFATKTDVILALRDQFSRRFLASVDNAMNACSPTDFRGRLNGWIAGAVDTYLGDFKLHDVIFHSFGHSHRQSKEKEAVLDQLLTLLEGGRAAGDWRFDNPRATALMLFGGMHSMVDDAIDTENHDLETMRRTLSDLFQRTLAGH